MEGRRGCIEDMCKDSAAEDGPMSQTLGNKPWQIDGGIDADRSKSFGGIEVRV